MASCIAFILFILFILSKSDFGFLSATISWFPPCFVNQFIEAGIRTPFGEVSLVRPLSRG